MHFLGQQFYPHHHNLDNAKDVFFEVYLHFIKLMQKNRYTT